MIIQFVNNYENIRGLPKIYRYECRKRLELARTSHHPLGKVWFSIDIFEKIDIQEASKPLCGSRVYAQCTEPGKLVYDQHV